MILLSAILIGAVALETTHDQVPDTTTVGEILNLGGYNATNAANWAIGQYDSTNLSSRISAKYTKPDTGIPMTDLKTDLQQTIYGKQDALVSGTNIKTINNQSILGSGNITIEGGGSGGTSNYNLLSNKPKINNIELVGNKSLTDIGAQGIIADYTTTNDAERIAAQIVTNNVAEWAMHGKAEPVTDLSSRTTFAQATNIAASAAVTNAGAVAYVDAQGYLTSESDPSVSATNPTFSNAVLSVTTGIDTNFVAVIGEFKEAWGDFPLDAGQTTATLGGLLAALAAAVAWLKKNKRDRTDNTCHETTSGFSPWFATPPSGYTFGDAQPTFDSTSSKWTWYVEGSSVAVDAESGTSTASATSATFTFNDSGTKTFTATRFAATEATENETFVTKSYVASQFSSENTSLTSTIKDCGGVQHDDDGYFIETED